MKDVDTGTDELLCTIDAGIATITLNRPEKRNALSDRLTPAFRNVLPVLEADIDVRVIVVTGAGKAFCSGGDVSGMGERRAPTTTEAAIRRLQQGQEALTLRLFELTKPTIAALPGAAAGAGMSIALACDLRIAAESALITTAFANIGLSGDYGGSWLLTRLVGTAKAKELYFTARRVGAAEALALGIVNEVVADDRLAARTKELAGQIAAGPPIALGYMKENLNRALNADLKTALALEADRMVRCNRTDDHKEAVRAFLEKRKPVFAGR
jgi:enoyl-CoA hydratase/carnithine racemase